VLMPPAGEVDDLRVFLGSLVLFHLESSVAGRSDKIPTSVPPPTIPLT
jgi:hypothetical protein